MTDAPVHPSPPADSGPQSSGGSRLGVAGLVGRITTLEWSIGALVAAVLAVLVGLEPDILEAPFENSSTIAFTLGGTLAAAAGFVAMLWFRVPAVVRVVALWLPFAVVSWWLLSPHFIDDAVDEEFSTSISAQLDQPTEPAGGAAAGDAPAEPGSAPVLLGAGQFVGLAGHSGSGDAGIFRNPDGSYVLRFENFDIDNGPDLEVYLVPGADQTSLAPGSVHLGALKGNVGNQSYELPPGTELAPGSYTALVWCEAFSVEFVGATLTIA